MPRTTESTTLLAVTQADLRLVVEMVDAMLVMMRAEAAARSSGYPINSEDAAEITEAETALRVFREAVKEPKATNERMV